MSGCDLSNASPDVWYRFTAPTTGPYTFDTCDELGFDSVLGIFDHCGGTELPCNDDGLCPRGPWRSVISPSLIAGRSYLIRVSGAFLYSGTFALNVSAGGPPPPPVNDSCAGAIPIAEGIDQPFDTTYATSSGLRVSSCGGASSVLNDIFYTHTPSRSGEAIISTCGTTWDTVVAVYNRCGGTRLACNDDDRAFYCSQSSGQSVVRLEVVAGRTYVIALGAELVWRDGRGVISVALIPDCPADFNNDGMLDHFDFNAFVGCFDGGPCSPARTADYNGDGFADFFDLAAYVADFEAGC